MNNEKVNINFSVNCIFPFSFNSWWTQEDACKMEIGRKWEIEKKNKMIKLSPRILDISKLKFKIWNWNEICIHSVIQFMAIKNANREWNEINWKKEISNFNHTN